GCLRVLGVGGRFVHVGHDPRRDGRRAPVSEQPNGPTTHASWGAGHPRLIITSEETRMTVDLLEDQTTIGSVGGNTIELPGRAPCTPRSTTTSETGTCSPCTGGGERTANPPGRERQAGPARERRAA